MEQSGRGEAETRFQDLRRVASQGMYYVYILRSLRDNNLYTGSTSDLLKRLKAHNSGKVKSTQKRKPFQLVYFEEHGTLTQSRKKENYLKSYPGGIQKQSLIQAFPQEKLARFAITRGPDGPARR